MKKFFTKKRVLAIALSVLMVVSVSFAINFILHEKRLNDLQNEYLLELELKKGSYAEDVIVLQNTTRARATELAEKTGASLRITSDGKFATLKYSGGKTVRTVIEDRENRRVDIHRTILKMEKLYDVSVVSLPANDATSISARSVCEGVIAEVKQERLAIEARRRIKDQIAIMAEMI